MTAASRPSGLVIAGVVLTVVGAVIVAIRSLGLPEYWIPLGVGIGLLVAGLVRSHAGGG